MKRITQLLIGTAFSIVMASVASFSPVGISTAEDGAERTPGFRVVEEGAERTPRFRVAEDGSGQHGPWPDRLNDVHARRWPCRPVKPSTIRM